MLMSLNTALLVLIHYRNAIMRSIQRTYAQYGVVIIFFWQKELQSLFQGIQIVSEALKVIYTTLMKRTTDFEFKWNVSAAAGAKPELPEIFFIV